MGRNIQKPYLLTVLTGPNAGAQERLSKGRITVAGSRAADICLDQLAGLEVEIALSQNRLRIKTDRDDVTLSSTGLCVPKVASFAALPATIKIGRNTQINICREEQMAPRNLVGWRSVTAVLAVCTLCVGAVVFSEGSLSAKAVVSIMPSSFTDLESNNPGSQLSEKLMLQQDFASENITAPETANGATDAAVVDDTVSVPEMTFENALAMIESRIAEEKLTGLSVQIADGAVRVSGRLTSSQTQSWAKIRAEYEQHFGQFAPILVKVGEQEEAAPLSIAAIWLGAEPELMTRAGEIMRIGDVTSSGWKIIGIAASEVKVERGQQTAIIDF